MIGLRTAKLGLISTCKNSNITSVIICLNVSSAGTICDGSRKFPEIWADLWVKGTLLPKLLLSSFLSKIILTFFKTKSAFELTYLFVTKILNFKLFSRLYDFRLPSLVIHDPELMKCVFVKNSQDFPTRRVSFLTIDKTNDLQLMMNSSLHQLKTHKKLFQKVNCLKSLHFNFQIFKSDELLNSMLSNTEGEQWRVLRTVISPTFSTGKLKLVCSHCHLGVLYPLYSVGLTGCGGFLTNIPEWQNESQET